MTVWGCWGWCSGQSPPLSRASSSRFPPRLCPWRGHETGGRALASISSQVCPVGGPCFVSGQTSSAELEGKQCRACHLTGLEGSRELLEVKRQVERINHPGSWWPMRPSLACQPPTCPAAHRHGLLPHSRVCFSGQQARSHLRGISPLSLSPDPGLAIYSFSRSACLSKSHLFGALF